MIVVRFLKIITFELKKIMRSSLWHFKAKNRSFNMLKLEVHIFFNSKVIIFKKRTTIINPEAVHIYILGCVCCPSWQYFFEIFFLWVKLDSTKKKIKY